MKKYTITNHSDKQLVFIGMVHVAPVDFHNEIISEVDTLKSQGFFHIFEGVSEANDGDIFNSLGIEFTNAPPDFSVNTLYQMMTDILGLSFEPSFKVSENSINVDISADKKTHALKKSFKVDYNRLRKALTRYSKVIRWLMNKPKIVNLLGKFIGDDYKPFMEKREKHLAEYIHTSDSKKILVTYGENHFNGLLKELKKLDSTWRLEE